MLLKGGQLETYYGDKYHHITIYVYESIYIT